ncbi:MAG TPA: phosphoenolpyruvate--protein phosphotransferase [Rhodopila sp.]|uniref:phosphoenolpyruvate--protein phosphotransferase n=1 Tax=Rhodopila sp. TaxID=2480087 RepID=UPI002C3BC0D7|nr:phosphoenolpyruvate--protein phosphotransferase [Rhodopila sp.]HVY17618.1 phosphoenolpyruvate--protein phosphotransferase [Rhodopila sp.]
MDVNPPRHLLSRLRNLRARGAAPLSALVQLVAAEMVSEVCSIYVSRPGDILELAATHGLNPEAIGHTRLRVGEGIVGLCAATATVMNLPDAQNHPAFAYRPETGEEPFASLLAVPVRRSGRILGVLVVQNRTPRNFTEPEIDDLETVAMLLAEMLPASGATDGRPEGVGATVPRLFSGTPLNPGIAVGPVVLLNAIRPIARILSDNPEAEQARLDAAVISMQRGLDDLFADAPKTGRPADVTASREILDAYRLVAADAGWLRRVAEVISTGMTAEAAVQKVSGELHNRMRSIGDAYLRERLADMEDLANRLLATLTGTETATDAPKGAILVARRMGPAELLDWHARGIAAVAIEEASPAGHAAILARALSIPALGNLRGILDAAENADQAVVDADDGQFILRPEAEVRDAYARVRETKSAKSAELAVWRERPAITADGVGLTLMLNVGLGLELPQLDRTGADGIGLFRTEIAMMARGSVADVAEQAAIYARVLDDACERPVIFRTLDLGADKLLPGTQTEEENPAMGWRSLRVGLDRPALLRRQLRALLLAAGDRPLSVMFPMVATVEEFRSARALLEAEAKRVRPSPRRLHIGTMLEVPALMWQLPELLHEVDFVSVGSNDLLQFLFAADRGTPSLYDRYDFLSAPVFNLLEQLSTTARAAGVPVSVCGEAASRPLEALAIAALGIHTLSMPASGILPIKAMFSRIDLAAFQSVLASLRRGGGMSLREPIMAWAREQGILE